MINLKAFEHTTNDNGEFNEYDLVDALMAFNDTIVEIEDISRSIETVTEIKDAIDGREIDGAMLAYAGESIGQIAPAFIAGDSDEAVQQMEEGLKKATSAIGSIIKKIFTSISNFFKKVIGFFKKKSDDITEKVDKLTNQANEALKKASDLKKSDILGWKSHDASAKFPEVHLYEILSESDVDKTIDAINKAAEHLESISRTNDKGKSGLDYIFASDSIRAIVSGKGAFGNDDIHKLDKTHDVLLRETTMLKTILNGVLIQEIHKYSNIRTRLEKTVSKLDKFLGSNSPIPDDILNKKYPEDNPFAGKTPMSVMSHIVTVARDIMLWHVHQLNGFSTALNQVVVLYKEEK